MTDIDAKIEKALAASNALPSDATADDFYAFLPEHKYIYRPTGRLWPATTINSILGSGAAAELDKTRPVHVMGWAPGFPELIEGKLLLEKGGWIDKPGARTYNSFIPAPELVGGDAAQAAPWVEHVKKLFPDDADRLFRWLAFKVRFPAIKINHGWIVGSDAQGIGKDTLFEPIVAILGPWNCSEVSAAQAMDEKFNPHLEALFCRISEANDLGDDNRFKFYERRKSWMVAPPAVLSVADKHVKAHPVINVVGIVVTGNSKAGLYLPAEDRRHDVAWSECKPSDFAEGYFVELYRWYNAGGFAHVKAYLDAVDLSAWDPKAPPPKGAAFRAIVAHNQSSAATNLGDLLDWYNYPFDDRPVIVTIRQLQKAAMQGGHHFDEAFQLLNDKRYRKQLVHELRREGYEAVENSAKKDGRWKLEGKSVMFYGRREVAETVKLDTVQAMIRAALAKRGKRPN
jgi:hypothetical protein